MYLRIIDYSDGSFRRDDDTFTSGSQCEDGLKMILVIGDAEFLTSGDGISDGIPHHSPGPPLTTQPTGRIALCIH